VLVGLASRPGSLPEIEKFLEITGGERLLLRPLERAGVEQVLCEHLAVDHLPAAVVALIAERADAWTGFASEPIGAVYLRRGKGSDTVEALSATCPHAGCFVEMEPTGRCFRCPCHNSTFTLEGGIVAPSPSPRPMDGLECRVAKNGSVEVKWERFRAGVAEKIVQ
jgi:nitrite reductase/ring-hydroxylating ferredoxin subunit